MTDAERWEKISGLLESQRKVLEMANGLCDLLEHEIQQAKEAVHTASENVRQAEPQSSQATAQSNLS